MRIPVGTTGQRPATGDIGFVRYNTTTHQFEGYGDNTVWQGLGGVIDADQDTYITADTNNADEDTLRLVTAGLERLTITSAGRVGIGTTSPCAKRSLHALNGETTTALFPIASSTASATTTLFVIDNRGKIGISTTSPDAMLSLTQNTNGTPFISAYRITDSAPSGDFINYKMNDGTALFRVDNSGNLLAGGIINSGSQTITSTGQPQFRVQYDPSNELTVSVGSTGTTTIGINGSAPSLAFTPQTNSVNTFNFTNALGANSILSIDTLNQRVGLGTTSPSSLLSVHGNTYTSGTSFFGGAITATSTLAIGGAITSTATAANTFPYASTTAFTSSGSAYFATTGGSVGVGTTSPWGLLSVNPNGITGPAFVVGSS